MFVKFTGEIIPGFPQDDRTPTYRDENLGKKIRDSLSRDFEKLDKMKTQFLAVMQYYKELTGSPYLNSAFDNVAAERIRPNDQYTSWEEVEEAMEFVAFGLDYIPLLVGIFYEAFTTMSILKPEIFELVLKNFSGDRGTFILEARWILENLEENSEKHAFGLRLSELVNQISDESKAFSVLLTFLALCVEKVESTKYILSIRTVLYHYSRFKSELQVDILEAKSVDMVVVWIEALYEAAIEDLYSYERLIENLVTAFRNSITEDGQRLKALSERFINHSPFGRVIAITIQLDIFKDLEMEEVKRLLLYICKGISKSGKEERKIFAVPIFELENRLDDQEKDYLQEVLNKDENNIDLIVELEELRSEFDDE